MKVLTPSVKSWLLLGLLILATLMIPHLSNPIAVLIMVISMILMVLL